MSKSYGQLIKNIPVLPLLVLISAKMIGVIFTAVVFDLQVTRQLFINSLNPFLQLNNFSGYELIYSYSDLFMFTALSLGLLFRLYFYTNKTEKLLTKEQIIRYKSQKLRSIPGIAFRLYGVSVYWVFMLLVAVVIIAVNTILGKTFVWVLMTAVVMTGSLLFFYFYDLEHEVELAKEKF